MIIRNKKLIALITIVSGIAITIYSVLALYNYSYTAIAGIKAQARVVDYKRVNRAGETHAAFAFTTPDGTRINGISKTISFRITRKSYNINEEINVSYNAGDPAGAVILSWREWPGSLLIIAFGLLLVFIGWQMITKKTSATA